MSPRDMRPRCGTWMPVAQTTCALPENHFGKCRTASAAKSLITRTNNYHRRRIAERQREVDRFKVSRGCERCGWRENAVGLDFDHLDPADKTSNISKLLRHAPWGVVLAELEKCRVLCSNCHRIWTLQPESFYPVRRRPEPGNTEFGPDDEIKDHLPGRSGSDSSPPPPW